MNIWLSDLINNYISIANTQWTNPTLPSHIVYTSAFKEYGYFLLIGGLILYGHSKRNEEDWG